MGHTGGLRTLYMYSATHGVFTLDNLYVYSIYVYHGLDTV